MFIKNKFLKGKTYPSQQWAAVTTQVSEIKDPPHMRLPSGPPRRRVIWCGNSPYSASVPPTIWPPPRLRGVERSKFKSFPTLGAPAIKENITKIMILKIFVNFCLRVYNHEFKSSIREKITTFPQKMFFIFFKGFTLWINKYLEKIISEKMRRMGMGGWALPQIYWI